MIRADQVELKVLLQHGGCVRLGQIGETDGGGVNELGDVREAQFVHTSGELDLASLLYDTEPWDLPGEIRVAAHLLLGDELLRVKRSRISRGIDRHRNIAIGW